MPRRDAVVIGASAGGLRALTTILSKLPVPFQACVLVAMHSAASSPPALANIVGRSTRLQVAFAETGDTLAPGRVFIAPPDVHLVVTPQGLALLHGPRENRFRPAIDPLFRSAARTLGERVVGVVLSGALSDGTFGLSVIKQHGGIAIVQDPDDAEVAAMPSNAIKAVDVDHVLPAAEIAGAIARLVDAPTGTGAAKGVVMAAGQEGPEPQRGDPTEVADMRASFGAPSALTCPDCGGVLWEVNDGRLVRYQCHVGHQYAPENLEEGQRDILDQALWSAVRVLEEQAELKTRMAARATNRQLSHVARGFETSARDARDQAQRLRDVLFSLDKPSGSKPDSKSG